MDEEELAYSIAYEEGETDGFNSGYEAGAQAERERNIKILLRVKALTHVDEVIELINDTSPTHQRVS